MQTSLYRVPTLEEIRQERKKRLVISMLTVFGDESADERKQRIFAVAGVMGTQEEWDDLTKLWLERTKGKAFHAADCESDQGEYKGAPHKENQRLYADLVRMLAKTNLMGFGVALDIQAHKEITRDTLENVPYQNCFLKVVIYFVKQAVLHVPPQKAKFVFDTNSETEVSSVVLYDYMRNTNDFKFGEDLFYEVAFAPRNSHVGIQAADILARETMKYFKDSFGRQRKRPERVSMALLRSTKRYHFQFLNRQYWNNYKNELRMVREMYGLKLSDYAEWRNKRNLPDNLTNRNRFILEKRGNKPS